MGLAPGSVEVHEVASLTEHSATTDSWILGPVISRNGACIAGINESLRTLQAGEIPLHIQYQRREATVKANHQEFLASVGGLDSRKFSSSKAERLLNEHVLAGR